MSTLAKTYVACCLLLLQDPGSPLVPHDVSDFVLVLDTLDLSLANLALLIVLLARYKRNDVNTLVLGDTSALNTAYYAMIGSLVLANKYMNDQSYTLKTWHSILAKCSHLAPTLPLLNQLEAHFLSAINYSVGTAHEPSLWDKFSHLDPYWLSQLRAQVEDGPVAAPLPQSVPQVPAQVAPPVAAAAAAPQVGPMPTPPSVPTFQPFAPLVAMAPVVLPAYCLGQLLQPHLHCTPVPTPPTVPPPLPRQMYNQCQFQALDDYVPMTPMLVGRKRRKVDDYSISINVGQPWYPAPMGAQALHKHY